MMKADMKAEIKADVADPPSALITPSFFEILL
jgi:hypothetical protein